MMNGESATTKKQPHENQLKDPSENVDPNIARNHHPCGDIPRAHSDDNSDTTLEDSPRIDLTASALAAELEKLKSNKDLELNNLRNKLAGRNAEFAGQMIDGTRPDTAVKKLNETICDLTLELSNLKSTQKAEMDVLNEELNSKTNEVCNNLSLCDDDSFEGLDLQSLQDIERFKHLTPEEASDFKARQESIYDLRQAIESKNTEFNKDLAQSEKELMGAINRLHSEDSMLSSKRVNADTRKGTIYAFSTMADDWKRYYIEIEKSVVSVYLDEFKKESLIEWTVDLNTEIFDVPGEVDGRDYLFYITQKVPPPLLEDTDVAIVREEEAEILYFSAESDGDKADWIASLAANIRDSVPLIYQPEIWSEPFYPSLELKVTYDNFVAVKGSIAKTDLVEHQPVLKMLHADPAAYHSIVMMDFDAVMNRAASSKTLLQWGICNIRGGVVSTGLEFASYRSPAPPKNSGMHRIFFIVFKQGSYVMEDQLQKSAEICPFRDGLSHVEWAKALGFSAPMGVTGFYTGWDEYCDVLHKKQRYMPPPNYRSPSQHASLKNGSVALSRPLPLLPQSNLSNPLSNPQSPSNNSILSVSVDVENIYLDTDNEDKIIMYSHKETFEPDHQMEAESKEFEIYPHVGDDALFNVASANADDYPTELMPYVGLVPSISKSQSISQSVSKTLSKTLSKNQMGSGVMGHEPKIECQYSLSTDENSQVMAVMLTSGQFQINWMKLVPELHEMLAAETKRQQEVHEYEKNLERAAAVMGMSSQSAEESEAILSAMKGEGLISVVASKSASVPVSPSNIAIGSATSCSSYTSVILPANASDYRSQLSPESLASTSTPLNSASHADNEGCSMKRTTSLHITTMLSNLSLGLGGSRSAVGSPTSTQGVNRCMSLNEEELNQKGLSRAKKISAGTEEKKYTKSPKDLMNFFRLDSLNVFTGEIVTKKHSRDFFWKDSFSWICPKTCTLHWAKFAGIDKEAPTKSKYIRLKDMTEYPDAKLGTMIDTVTSVKLTSTGIVCNLKSNKSSLEFKMNSASSLNWFNVMTSIGAKDTGN